MLQLIAAVGFLFLIRFSGGLTTSLFIPFANVSVYIPEPIYFIFVAFVIVGTVNSVNITDGVDGLATGVTIPVAVCFAFIAMLWKQEEAGLFAASIAGGLVAFLFFNFHPAKVFMGDTGSLALGGFVAAISILLKMPLFILIVALIYLIEVISVIIQVVYFKKTRRRFFKMAPIHHSFELSGWSETKIVALFYVTTAILCLIGYLGGKTVI